MKKQKSLTTLIKISLLALVLGGVFAFAAEDNYTTEPARFRISNIPMKVMAERKQSAPYWTATGQYGHGDMIRTTNSTKRVYWNVSNCTNKYLTVTMPTHAWGDVADGTTNIWRRVMPGPRVGYTIQNAGTARVWFSIGHAAVTNAGFFLDPGGAHYIDNASVQDWISAISTNVAVTNVITTQEQ